MEHEVENIASTLDFVVKHMVKAENLDEKLSKEYTDVSNILCDENDDVVEQIESKISLLQQKNEHMKKTIADLVSRLHTEDQHKQVQEITWEVIKSCVLHPGKQGKFLIVSSFIGVLLLVAVLNTDKMIDNPENLAKSIACENSMQGNGTWEDECLITWSYEVSFSDMSLNYKGSCKDLCTDISYSVMKNDQLDAIKTCIEELYKKLPNDSHKKQIGDCSKCVGDEDENSYSLE